MEVKLPPRPTRKDPNWRTDGLCLITVRVSPDFRDRLICAIAAAYGGKLSMNKFCVQLLESAVESIESGEVPAESNGKPA